jgi:hypothetical protein
MTDLEELRADADASAAANVGGYQHHHQSRVSLQEKVVMRLSELLSDSLLESKLSAIGVTLAHSSDELQQETDDVEWVSASELASNASVLNSSASLTMSSSTSIPPPLHSQSVYGETDELLVHARVLRRSSGSRKTIVKAAELLEELLGSDHESEVDYEGAIVES